ncbi:ComEC/Rec2 family competence protein [Flagellimonas olearia]|uniref:ComEC/Rec2 family competence protein n=1 Tax=Flagellimonas olearia TaxID=552546 RepID=UPI002011B323|nr:ComEC/Rec2 family competence protein [Allomuricauda olearia]
MGIVLGFYLDIAPRIPFIAICIMLPILYFTYKRQARDGIPFFELTTLLITTSLGMLVVSLSLSNNLGNHYSHNNFTLDQLWQLKVKEILKPNPYTQRYVVEAEGLEQKEATGKLLLSLPVDSTKENFKIDEKLFVFTKAETIQPPLNPYQFNYKGYLKKQGIFHQIRTNHESIVVQETSTSTMVGLASSFREHLIAKLKEHPFGKDELAVIQALLLGQRDDISEETYNNYSKAGAIHILAVSGLHVGILLFIFQFLLSPLERFPKGKTLKLVGVVFLLWAYAFVAGLSPSIVRAVTMFSFVAYALYLNRPTNAFNIIALSMWFILLIKPLFLFQVGFQMSYAAVFAIVWIYPKLQRFWFPEHIIVRKIWQLLSVSLAAQLGVLPISLFYFHQFPALFFVSNLLIIPFLGLILGLGILVMALALLNQLPTFLVVSYNWVIQTINSIVGWVAQQEEFVIKDIPFDGVQLVLGYALVISVVVFLSHTKRKPALILCTGIIAFQTWGIWNQIQLKQKEALVLVHKSQNTILLHQLGNALHIYAQDSLNSGSIVRDYSVAERIKTIDNTQLKNSYSIGQKKLYIMDSLGIYPENKNQDFVLLTQSPKINLERLLDSVRPKMVLADGSNYPSYVSRWKRTCTQKEIPFHHTGEKGAYYFND